jgi:hypothetical protein
METKKRQPGGPASAPTPSRRSFGLALGGLILLLGLGAAAPARATTTIINTAVAGPIAVNSGDEVDIVAGGSVTVGDAVGTPAVTVNAGGTLNISGGSVTAGANAVGVFLNRLFLDGGTLNISGGTISSGNVGVVVDAGAVSITGGSVTGLGDGIQVGFSSSPGSPTVSISGGSVTGNIIYGVIAVAGTTTISGGSVTGGSSGVAVVGGTVSISGCNLALSNPAPGFCGTMYSLTGTLRDGTGINTVAQVCPPGQLVLDNRCGPTDTTPPTTAAVASPGPNANGWNNTNVNVTLSAVDNPGGSGVKQISYSLSGAQTGGAVVPGSSASVLISAEGTTTLTYFATDNAGNQEAAHSLTVNIDKTPPVVTYTGNAGTYTVDQMVNITCSATDNLSGVASSTCQNISGPAYSFPLGTNSFSAAATDKAGNMGTGSTSFTVQATPGGLVNLVTQFVTNPGVAQGLTDKLNAIASAIARGNANAKAGIVGAFINQVNAQTGKSITAQHAAILIRLVSAL